MDQYDLIVIGGGSGGVRAARMAAGNGLKVALVEERYLGGTCVNVGCVPKKLMVYASEVTKQLSGAAGFGWQIAPPSFDWSTLIANKNNEIGRLNGIYRNLLDNAGVSLFEGHGQFINEHEVMISGGATIYGHHILIAVGGWPYVPEITGREYIKTSNEFFFLDDLPERALIVGGGYIAVELAGILNGLGTKVTLSYRKELFLRGFDDDVRQFLKARLIDQGIDLWFNSEVKEITSNEKNQFETSLIHEGEAVTHQGDLVLYATGRNANTANLGLEAAGITPKPNGALMVGEDYRTEIPHIFAIGDVIERVALTPVAIHEGMIIANILSGKPWNPIDYQTIPSAVFSQPPIGTVGISEQQAIAQYGKQEIMVYQSEYRPMKATMTGANERAMMKLIVRKSDERVLGLHMVGPDAGEITQGFAVAINMGARKRDFDRTIGIHPTAAEEFVTMRLST